MQIAGCPSARFACGLGHQIDRAGASRPASRARVLLIAVHHKDGPDQIAGVSVFCATKRAGAELRMRRRRVAGKGARVGFIV